MSINDVKCFRGFKYDLDRKYFCLISRTWTQKLFRLTVRPWYDWEFWFITQLIALLNCTYDWFYNLLNCTQVLLSPKSNQTGVMNYLDCTKECRPKLTVLVWPLCQVFDLIHFGSLYPQCHMSVFFIHNKCHISVYSGQLPLWLQHDFFVWEIFDLIMSYSITQASVVSNFNCTWIVV